VGQSLWGEGTAMKWNILLSSGILLFILILAMSSSDALQTFMNEVKAKEVDQSALLFKHLSPATTEDKRAMIASKADKLRIAPKNARIDRIWKAIPGYNGLEVDIDATLTLYLNHPLPSKIPFVFKEIEPEVKLADLPAAPIYRGNSDKSMISFMINVAWGNEYLPSILETLRDEEVKATFFLDGSWLKNNKEIALDILKEGHELSNHAYSHKNMSRLSYGDAADEIRKTETLLKEIGVHNRLFAPPSGDYDDETVRIAKEFDLYTILWTLDTVDWKKPTPAWVYQRITSNLEPGALILMHPTQASSESLKSMIQYAKKKGYSVGTVSELISEKRLPEVEQSVDIW
jgi:probable sporulation protein (polysaccharide deacetylase family)